MAAVAPLIAEKKKWYLSKTLWVNAVGFAAVVAQAVSGYEVIDAKLQVSILAGINFLLRIITKQGLA